MIEQSWHAYLTPKLNHGSCECEFGEYVYSVDSLVRFDVLHKIMLLWAPGSTLDLFPILLDWPGAPEAVGILLAWVGISHMPSQSIRL